MTEAVAPTPTRPAYDLESGVVHLRPLRFTDILDGAFTLFRTSKWLMIPIVLAVMVPLQLLVTFLQREALSFGLAGVLDDPAAAEVLFGQGTISAALVISILSQVIIAPVLAGALAYVAAATMTDHQVGLGDTVKATLRRAGWLVGVYVGGGLIRVAPLGLVAAAVAVQSTGGIIVGILLTVIVFAGLTPLFAVITPALMVAERPRWATIWGALGLCRRAYWRTVLTILGTSVVFNLLALLLAGIPNVIGLLAGLGFGWVLVAFGSALSQLIVAPLTAAAMVLLHADLRIRQEGMDFDVVLERLHSQLAGV